MNGAIPVYTFGSNEPTSTTQGIDLSQITTGPRYVAAADQIVTATYVGIHNMDAKGKRLVWRDEDGECGVFIFSLCWWWRTNESCTSVWPIGFAELPVAQ